jgi:Bacteriophage holin of superfamily 6 (Holin_LLH)
MSVIGRVRAFFENLWTNTLQPDVKTAEQVAEGFFSAAISDAATQLGAVGLKIVTDGVTAAETAGGTGAAKLAAATTAITADLSTAGIQAAAHIVNAAIEGAVSQLNSNNKAVTTPTADAAPEAAPDLQSQAG